MVNTKVIIYIIILLSVTVFFYLDSFRVDYISDDYYFLNDINSFRDIFPALTIGFLRPLVRISFFAEFSLFGKSPAVSHFVNLLLHIISALLAFSLVMRLFNDLSLAFGSALIFSLHHVQVEAVTWVSARSESILFIFGVLFLLSFLKGCRSLSILLFFLTLISKESGFVYFFILVIILISKKEDVKKIVKQTYVFFLMIIFYFFAYYIATLDKEVIYLSDINRIIPSFLQYLRLYVYPGDYFTVFYALNIIIILILLLRKNSDAGVFITGLAFFFLPLFMMSYSNQLFYRYRYLYTSALGFSILCFYITREIWNCRFGNLHKTLQKIIRALYLFVIFFYILLALYNAYLIKMDFHKYSKLYSHLGDTVSQQYKANHTQAVILSGFPRTLGRTRLLFLMISDTLRYHTGTEIYVLHNNRNLISGIKGLYEKNIRNYASLRYSAFNNSISTDKILQESTVDLLRYLDGEDFVLKIENFSVQSLETNYIPDIDIICEETACTYIINFGGRLIFPIFRASVESIELYLIKRSGEEMNIDHEKGLFIIYDNPGYMERDFNSVKIVSESGNFELKFKNKDLERHIASKHQPGAKAYKR